MNRSATWLLCIALLNALSTGAVEFTFKESFEVGLTVNLYERVKEPVSPLLFSKFSEHVGRNVYGGLWAECIANPGMDRFWQVARRPKATMSELKQTNRTELIAAIEKKLPYHWYPLGDSSAVYSFANITPLSKPNASVCTLSRDVKELTGFQQTVALPAHRCTDYELTLHLRHQEENSIPVKVLVANADNGNVALNETVPNLGKRWKRHSFKFSIRK
jgi:alpha-N-arabinofuranosidase